jgi:uncharacterized membrane protein
MNQIQTAAAAVFVFVVLFLLFLVPDATRGNGKNRNKLSHGENMPETHRIVVAVVVVAAAVEIMEYRCQRKEQKQTMQKNVLSGNAHKSSLE